MLLMIIHITSPTNDSRHATQMDTKTNIDSKNRSRCCILVSTCKQKNCINMHINCGETNPSMPKNYIWYYIGAIKVYTN